MTKKPIDLNLNHVNMLLKFTRQKRTRISKEGYHTYIQLCQWGMIIPSNFVMFVHKFRVNAVLTERGSWVLDAFSTELTEISMVLRDLITKEDKNGDIQKS